MSYNIADDSDATKIFVQRSNREFSQEFLGRKTIHDIEHEKKLREFTLKIAEAEAAYIEQKKLVNLARTEARELRIGQKEAFDKYEKCKRELDALKVEVDRLREIEKEFTAKKSSTKFLLSNYRSALSKYKTWYSHENKQTEVMKEILVEIGKWNPENRYRIYFAYKSDPPSVITDDDVEILAKGSILDYHGVDDIDNVHSMVASTKFFNISTQTEGVFNNSASDGSLNFTSGSFPSNRGSSSLSSIKVSDTEFQFLDLRERLKKTEQENLNLKEQLFIAKNANKERTILEEQNRDLNSQIKLLMEHNRKILDEQECLKEAIQNNIFTDLAGPSSRASSREIIDRIMKEKERNDTLLRKTMELEEEVRQLKMSQKSSESMEEEKQTEDSRNSTIEQTATEPSVFMCHWKDNPYSLAVKEYEEKEAKRRKLDTSGIDGRKYYDAMQEVEKLQKEIKLMNEQKERTANFTAESARRYRECIRLLTGYDVKMRNEEYIEMSSVYDPTNQFSFQKVGKEINVLDNQYAKTWRQTMEKYLPASLPSFTAAVTIELYMRQLSNNSTFA